MDSKNLPITGPCPIDLDAIGFDRSSKRSHCGHCEKSVHVLSNMTEREARGFMTENAGKKLCVSYARSKDGTVQFKPEPTPQIVPLARLSRRPAAAAAGLGLAMALAACTPHSNNVGEMVAEDIEVVEGGIEMEEPCEKPKDGVELAGKMSVPEPPPVEMVEGEMPIEEPPSVPLAGAMVMPPPPPPETDMLDGEMEIMPPETQVEPKVDEVEMHARGSRQVLHFDD